MANNTKSLSYWKDKSDFNKHLFPFLSPTSPGTEYWESQPPGKLTERQIGRICLQVHQLAEKITKTSNQEMINFLDIGTGNGFIPRLIPYFKDINLSHGCDPFLEGEHQTSFQKHNREDEFERILNFIKSTSDENNILSFKSYSEKTNNEHFYGMPTPIKLIFDKKKNTSYKFFQIGAHELKKLENSYNFLYCKAIEHIHDWPKVFENAFHNSSNDAVFYLKHKSFFSYLGAHRYGSTGLPWGHLRMTNIEYENYVDSLLPKRANKMKDFFYNGLSYPRNTIGNMIKIASSKGWKLGSVEFEKSKYIDDLQRILFSEDSLIYKEIKENHDVSIEELLSGLVHIIFTK